MHNLLKELVGRTYLWRYSKKRYKGKEVVASLDCPCPEITWHKEEEETTRIIESKMKAAYNLFNEVVKIFYRKCIRKLL